VILINMPVSKVDHACQPFCLQDRMPWPHLLISLPCMAGALVKSLERYGSIFAADMRIVIEETIKPTNCFACAPAWPSTYTAMFS